MIYSIPTEAFSCTEAHKQFFHLIQSMVQDSRYMQNIEQDVFQPHNEKNQKNLMTIVGKLLQPKSAIVNVEHLEKMSNLLKKGKSCLLLPEHFSNFDYPSLFYLSQKNSTIAPMFQNTICMAAAKLNTESKIVLAFSEAVNRIMIHSPREKEKIQNRCTTEEQRKLELLNQRGLKKMLEYKNKGHAILMFPAGTRYRNHEPKSRQALQQVASFIKRFDYFCLIGIAGNVLIINPNTNTIMRQDIVRKDTLIYLVDEVQESKKFLNSMQKKDLSASSLQFKNRVAEKITNSLMELHEKAEAIRAPLIKTTPPLYLGPFIPETIAKKL